MLKRIMLIFAVALTFAVSGCAGINASINESSLVDNTSQVVFAIKSGYTTALKAAVAYKELPTCSASVKNICSDPQVVAQIQKADVVAFQAISTAQAAVDTLGGVNARNAMEAARAAVFALTSLIKIGAR